MVKGKNVDARSANTQTKKELPLGIVLSGGGSRGAYQVGALSAVAENLREKKRSFNVVVGSSLGAINGILLSACARGGIESAITLLEGLWNERTIRNTFRGSTSRTIFRAVQIAILRYHAPGPQASNISIFDPTPLRTRLNDELVSLGGLRSDAMPDSLIATGVMTTLEGARRRPMLLACTGPKFVENGLDGATFDLVRLPELTAEHGFASAALPSVLPAVDLDIDTRQVRLIDGGICDNTPVDPAVRLGAKELIVIDSSGRRWWFDHYGEPHDTRPRWEVPAEEATYCLTPERMTECINIKPFGPLLKAAVGQSRKDFLAALGPTWPIFRLLKHKMGEELAYEVMSYVALHPDYTSQLIELGYEETKKVFADEKAAL